MGSKSALLENLRRYCMNNQDRPLARFFPRSYDLSNPRGLFVFLLDFAVTRAEAVLQNISAGVTSVADSNDIMAATKLLDRLVPVFEREWDKLNTSMSTKWPPGDDIVGLTSDEVELALRSPSRPRGRDEAALPDSDSSEAALFAALKMEMRWWLKHFEDAPHRQGALNNGKAIWILKEPTLNCGRGVNVFSDLVPLLAAAQRGSWDFVVQKYLERPLLVGADQRKCDVRLWVLVTSWNPAVVWAWSEPYFRLASKPFSWDQCQVSDPFVHLTNRAVAKEKGEEGNCGQPRSVDEDHIWLLPAFFAWAADAKLCFENGTTARDRWTNHTWPRMLDAVRTCVRSSQVDVSCHKDGCFELFGFDFLLDTDLEPWLLEANSSPDLCEDAGPSLRRLAESALTELFCMVPALHAGTMELPQSSVLGAPECDLFVNGSGRWRLCLREEAHCSAKEMELRRILKPPRQKTKGSQSAGLKGSSRGIACSHEHCELLRHFLGPRVFSRLQARSVGVEEADWHDPAPARPQTEECSQPRLLAAKRAASEAKRTTVAALFRDTSFECKRTNLTFSPVAQPWQLSARGMQQQALLVSAGKVPEDHVDSAATMPPRLRESLPGRRVSRAVSLARAFDARRGKSSVGATGTLVSAAISPRQRAIENRDYLLRLSHGSPNH